MSKYDEEWFYWRIVALFEEMRELRERIARLEKGAEAEPKKNEEVANSGGESGKFGNS